MKKALVTLIVILIFVFSAFYDKIYNSNNLVVDDLVTNESVLEKIDKQDLPKFNFKSLDKEYVSIEQYKGRPFLLNFWASWCGPCIEEFPYMMNLLKKNPKLVLIAVSNDQKIKDIKKFISKFKKEYQTLLESDQVVFAHDPFREISADKFNVLKLPETFIVNKDLKIVRKIVGAFEWKNPDLEKFLNTL